MLRSEIQFHPVGVGPSDTANLASLILHILILCHFFVPFGFQEEFYTRLAFQDLSHNLQQNKHLSLLICR